ncbi:MAG: glycosyltransferase family 87 protein [Acidobacteriota bacterium]
MSVKLIKISCCFLIAGFLIALGLVFIKNLIDFPVYYAAGQSLLSGRTDLYAPDFALGRVMDYRYPPFFLLLFLPLWLLPYKVAAYFWYLFSIFQIIGCLIIFGRILNQQKISKWVWAVLFLSTGQYFIQVLHYGNAHLLITFLTFLSLYFVFTKKEIWAALCLATAITIKLTPIFLFAYFFFKKRWHPLLYTGIFLITLNLLPALYFGFSRNNELFRQWFSHVAVNQEFHEANGPINLSLKGQLRRYFSDIDYGRRVDGDTRYPAVNLLSISPSTLDKYWMGISLFLIILAGYLFQKRMPDSIQQEGINLKGNLYLLETGIFISLLLLIGPLTSKIYFIALLLPVFALAAAQFAEQSKSVVTRNILIIISLLNFVLPLLPGRSLQRWLLVIGVDFYINMLVLMGLLYTLWLPAKLVPQRYDELPPPILKETKKS